ncbi:hypothetical protein FHT77_005842 [Rhizobium sp. BK181]|nr:hypothetical protein [Rhizobium sp. BK181]
MIDRIKKVEKRQEFGFFAESGGRRKQKEDRRLSAEDAQSVGGRQERTGIDAHEVMGFVNDQDIWRLRNLGQIGMTAALEPIRELIEPNLFDQFAMPLPDEVIWHTNQNAGLGIVDKMLADDEPGFDGLAQSNLIGEEVSLDRIAQDTFDGGNLVGDIVDACRGY